ncbi:hypothetical protein VNO77_22740 [Canavalia gladiata]|uniref:Uncharacterized protein n=1 Tax=Canavalia gladiata TaxID=3824 RepID=A0AAN9L5R5_CANGL
MVKRSGENSKIMVCTGGMNTYGPEISAHFVKATELILAISHQEVRIPYWISVIEGTLSSRVASGSKLGKVGLHAAYMLVVVPRPQRVFNLQWGYVRKKDGVGFDQILSARNCKRKNSIKLLGTILRILRLFFNSWFIYWNLEHCLPTGSSLKPWDQIHCTNSLVSIGRSFMSHFTKINSALKTSQMKKGRPWVTTLRLIFFFEENGSTGERTRLLEFNGNAGSKQLVSGESGQVPWGGHDRASSFSMQLGQASSRFDLYYKWANHQRADLNVWPNCKASAAQIKEAASWPSSGIELENRELTARLRFQPDLYFISTLARPISFRLLANMQNYADGRDDASSN